MKKKLQNDFLKIITERNPFMKNLLKLLVVFAVAVAMLVSCSTSGESTDNNNSSNNTTGGNTSGNNQKPSDTPSTEDPKPEGGWKENDVVYYIGASDVYMEDLILRFMNDASVVLTTNAAPEGAKTFVLGECNNSLSKLAYSKLEKEFAENSTTDAYLIYTDGNSVAIAYYGTVARYAAMEHFFGEFENLDLSRAGVIAKEEFDTREYVNAMREEQREKDINALSYVFSEDTLVQFKNLYSFYDERVYIWLANLYEPSICICDGECQKTPYCGAGGFYYSNSGRNTIGFLPDLESTAQALKFLVDSGMLADYDNKYINALSPETKAALLQFAKNCQDVENGYFYHPQWGKDITRNRLGRDLSWATDIISGLGSKPYYNTPNGVEGEHGKPGTTEAVCAPLRESVVSAVSKVIPASTPSYFSSVDAFKAHLETDYDFEADSYKVGNALESELGQIQNAGPDFTEALVNYLSSKQKDNGLWEDEINYNSVNGLMKISVVYTSLKKEIPKADLAMSSAIIMLKDTEKKAAHVCSVYNPWAAVSNILISIERTSGSAAANALREQFRQEATELIKITAEKLSVFKKDDGAFSYYIKYSAANSQGSAVALEKSEESDVNATMICTNSIITAMFNVFGIDSVSRYYPLDYAYFSDVLLDLGVVVKDKVRPAEPIIFDEYDKLFGEEEGGVVKYPDDFVENIVGDKEFESGKYKWFESSVVKNPVSGSKSDLVLHAKSNVFVGAEKSLADKPSSTRFKIYNAGLTALGNCFVYDAEMYFVPGYGKTSHSGKATSEPIMQLFFMTDSLPCASVNLSVYTENGVDYIKIGENFAGVDGKESNVAGAIPMGEWVNIRLEYYKNYVTNEEGKVEYKPMMKIFVNGKFLGDCDATITGTNAEGAVEYYDRKVDQVSISYYRYLASEVYFNNVLVERCNKKYVEGENPDAIKDPPLPEEDMRESYGFEDGLLNTSNVANKIRVVDFGVKKFINATAGQKYNPNISYSIVADPTGAANNVLKVEALRDSEIDKPSRTEVNLYNSGADGTDYVFSGKFYYQSNAIGKNGDLTQLFFFDTAEGQAYSLRIYAISKNDIFTLSLIENNDADGGTGSGVTIAKNIACDQWFTLKVVLHRTGEDETTGASIYLNNELVLEDESYLGAALGNKPIFKVALVHQKTNNSTLYLDDLSFARSGETHEVVESENRVADFEEGYNTKYLHSYTFDGSEKLDVAGIDLAKMESLYTKFSLEKDPADKTNRVLKAINKSGGTNAGYTEVQISNENPAGDCYTFETKMYIETARSGYNVTQFRFTDTNGGDALNLYVYMNSSAIQIKTTGDKAFPKKGTDLLADSGITIGKSKWFTVRIELYHKGADASESNTYVKLYLNDTLAFSGICYNSLGYAPEHVKIVHCKTTQSSAVYFDDISFSRTNKEYAKD